MKMNKFSLVLIAACMSTACTNTGEFDTAKAITLGAGVVQATTLTEESVQQTASLAAQELDSKSPVAGPNDPYTKRLQKIINGLKQYDGMNLNFKVYLTPEINAFAMADGTVRIHSGLLDAMPDDQVLAVIGHEIGHVKLRHSYKQMREQLLTNVAFEAAGSVGGTVGQLTQGQLGQLAKTAVNAKFSQLDELESDAYAVQFLRSRGKDPYAMKRSIETLQQKYGSGGGFLSSHPSNDARISGIDKAIKGE